MTIPIGAANVIRNKMDLEAINEWIKSSLLNGERITISNALDVRHIWMEDGEIKSIHYPDLGDEDECY